jgi:subtilisin family serine protease
VIHIGLPTPWRGLGLAGAVAGSLLRSLVTPAVAEDPSSVMDAQWPIETGGVRDAWRITQGEGVTVAVLDSGVNATHPDLRGQVVDGGDFGDGPHGPALQDSAAPYGHGTQLASLIAGSGRNYRGHGLYGVAPGARVASFNVFRDGEPEPAAVAGALDAAHAAGASVVLTPPLISYDDAQLAAVRQAQQRDMIVVSAAPQPSGGNPNVTPRPMPGVLLVTAVDRLGHPGDAITRAGRLTLAGPGVQVLAASANGSYWTGSDNAFAAAWVAGAAALVRAAHPDWTASRTI